MMEWVLIVVVVEVMTSEGCSNSVGMHVDVSFTIRL